MQSKSLERLVDSAPTNKFLSKFKICFLSFWLGVGVFQVDLNDLQVSEFDLKNFDLLSEKLICHILAVLSSE